MSFFSGPPVRLRGDSNFDRIIDYLKRILGLGKAERREMERMQQQLIDEIMEGVAKRKALYLAGEEEEYDEEWYNSIMASYHKPRKKARKTREESEWLEESARRYQQRIAEAEANTRRRFEWQKQKDERLRELQYQFSEHGTHYEEIQRVRGMVNPY